jgi:hypothetical protein
MLRKEDAATYLRAPVAAMRYWRHLDLRPAQLPPRTPLPLWRTDVIGW